MDAQPYKPPPGKVVGPLVCATEDERRRARQQEYVNHLLNRGVVFTVIWLGGIGSLYAIYLAIKARRVIRASGGQMRGMGRVWWCFLVGGGLGVLLVITCLSAILMNG